MNGKIKTFWDRPEGKTGAIIAIGIIVVITLLFIHFLPTLLILAQNTLYLILMGLAIGGIAYVGFDSKFRTLIGSLYKLLMKEMTGFVIQIDPIGIIENYIDEIKSNMKKMNSQIGNLNGQIKSLDQLTQENIKDIHNLLLMAKNAKNKNYKQVQLKTRQAAQIKNSNVKLIDLKVRLEMLYRVLYKMYENSDILLEETILEVDIKKRERKAILAGYSAMRSAIKMIKGDGDKKMMFDQAMEFLADDVGQKVGEMERCMEVSANFMESIDIQNGIVEEEGLKMLEKWEKDDSFILGDQKQVLINQAKDDHDILNLDNNDDKHTTNQFSNLFFN